MAATGPLGGSPPVAQATEPQTLLIVGNGLTLDLVSRSGTELFTAWHPTRPFDWDVRTEDGRIVRPDLLPYFFGAVDAAFAANPDAGHFEVIDDVLREARAKMHDAERDGDIPSWDPRVRDPSMVITEAHHFLALAYTAFDLQVEARADDSTWAWTRYLQRCSGGALQYVVSFNYDRVIERALSTAGLDCWHVGVEFPRPGVPVGKPHGSIDYALEEHLFNVEGYDYPLKAQFENIDLPMRVLPRDKLAVARYEVSVVPPLQASTVRHRLWVTETFRLIQAAGPHMERCIFAGLSAWPVDQSELREVIRALAPSTEIVVANPDWKAYATFDFMAQRLGRPPVTWWREGPPA